MECNRTRAYFEDLRWRMIHQCLMLGLTYQQIANSVCVDTSTVWRAVQKFLTEETIGTKYFQKIFITQTVLEKLTAYLREICSELLVKTGTTVSESAICRFLQHNTFCCTWLPRNVISSWECHSFLTARLTHQRWWCSRQEWFNAEIWGILWEDSVLLQGGYCVGKNEWILWQQWMWMD